jgi:hypothetical protein
MDSEKANTTSSEMWERLGRQFEEAISDMVNSDPEGAIQYAICAEACFWQSTGEADCHGIKEAFKVFKTEPPKEDA